LKLIIYDAAGNVLFTQNEPAVTFSPDGIFNVILGGGVGFPANTNPTPGVFDFNAQYFLGVSIDGGAELLPRTPFVSAPYALNSERVNGIEANTVPTPGMLLPLGPDGKFPASVLPQAGGFSSINGIPLQPDSALTIQAVNGSPITVSTNQANRTISIGFTGGSGITEIIPGPGLTGGGKGPIVTIGVADNGITTRMLGTGVVTGRKLDQGVAGIGLYQDALGNLNVGVDKTLRQDTVNDVIGLNLSNPNTWLAPQTFNGGMTVNGTSNLNGPVNITGGPFTIGTVLNPVTINHFGNTTHNGNVLITGTLTVNSPSTFNGIINLGTLDQQSTIFNSSANNGGAVAFNDPQGILNQQGGINNTGNIVSVGNLTNTGTLSQNGASTFNGTFNQLNGNASIAGGAVNSFGTVGGSANTIGAAGSTNTFNGNDVFNVTGTGNMTVNGLAEPNAVTAAAVLNYELVSIRRCS
jgi:hypothetical protein